jgi:L-alanine-DL-glutamate epimerase-like enolase superfamily enzyme
MDTLSRRSFLGSAAAAALPAFRYSPLDGVKRENLKITDVKVTLLSYELPPAKQWVSARFLVWKCDSILLEVFTDKGIVGIGEPSPYGGPEQIKQFIEEYARPRLIGQNPFDVERLCAAWGDSPSRIQVAWGGLDAALWDIIGKARGVPVWKLLATDNAPNPHIRMYASGGVEYAWNKRPEALIEEAVRHKEAGYTAFKFRIGTEWKPAGMTVQKYIPWVRKLREAVGPKMDLMQESNMRLSLDECLELCPVLEELRFLWFEEPINRRGEKAIEGGESMVTRFDFKQWIDRDAYDIVQPDCNTTGITEAWHIARIAALRDKHCCPHNWHGGLTTMANAALVAGIPNRFMLELNQTFNPLKEEVFRDPLVVRKGYMDLPDRPGFGVAVAPGLAKKFPYVLGSYSKQNPDL